MKLRRNKKGFTIVELVIVIAVIGILAAVLIPTFVNLNNKANKAADESLVKNLNTALAMQEQEVGDLKNNTMHDAVEDLKAYGYLLPNLATKSDDKLLWNQETNRFILEDGDKEGYPDIKFWRIQDSIKGDEVYSIYAGVDFKGNGESSNLVVDTKIGFDTGYHNELKEVNYVNKDTGKDVVIRTSGDQCVFTIDAPQDNIDFYGYAKAINVTAVKGESLHIYGATNKLSVTSGHVDIEDTGIVFELAANTGSVSNEGYIASQTGGTAPTGAAVGGDYEIGSLARLESFRDAVNSGNTFEGMTAKLTADITLRDGWIPIGEGSRKAGSEATPIAGISGVPFRGIFNGNNKTISNLNNKGFEPTEARIGVDGNEKMYAYGLFAITASGAEIKNLKLANVDIDSTRFDATVRGDSVGAIVGFSAGALSIENCQVTGSIRAYDAVGGLVGRAYRQDKLTTLGNVKFKDCINNAKVEAIGQNAGGLLGFASNWNYLNLEFENSKNNGKIIATSGAAGLVNFGYTGKTITVTNCVNNGLIEVAAAGRGAHLISLINQHKGDVISPSKTVVISTSNSHTDNAKVTLKAKSEVKDDTTANHNFTYWNSGSILLETAE